MFNLGYYSDRSCLEMYQLPDNSVNRYYLNATHSLAVSRSPNNSELYPDYVYVADGNNGLLILNASTSWEYPFVNYVSKYSTTGEAILVDINSDSVEDEHKYAYVVEDFGNGTCALDVIDISDPTSPYLAGQELIEGSVQDIDITGNYLYLTGYLSGPDTLVFKVADHDTNGPIVEITSHIYGQVELNNSVTISGTANDDVGISTIHVNGVLANGTTNWSANVTLLEGENIISVVAKDLEGNKNKKDIKIVYFINDKCHPLFLSEPQIEIGGTYYIWFKAIPYSTISMASDHLTYSQPDKNGFFYISVDTAAEEFTEGMHEISASNVVLSIGDDMYDINSSMFNFPLEVLQRDHSTSWYSSKKSGGGAGFYVYGDHEINRDFKLTAGTLDTNLIMNRIQDSTLTAGASVGFEAQAGVVEVSALNTDAHVGHKTITGSQVHVDYEQGSDTEKLESVLYMLTSVVDSKNPMAYKAIDAIANQIETDLSTDYYESGVATLAGVGVDIVKFDSSLGGGSSNEASATLASLGLGFSYDNAKSVKSRVYPENEYQELLIQYIESDKGGLSESFLGNEILRSGWDKELDETVIFGYDENEKLYGKAIIKDNVYSDEDITRQIICDYGEITDSDVVNPFENENCNPADSFLSFFKNTNNFASGNVIIQETKANDYGCDFPISAKVGPVKLTLHNGVVLGTANSYPTEKQIIYNKMPYVVEEYSYDTHVNDSAHDLINIFEKLLKPVGTALESAVDVLAVEISSASNVVFSGGSLFVPQSQNQNISVTTFGTEEPAPVTMQMFETMGVSSSFVTSMSGGGFVIGNITDLQPYNLTFEQEAELTLYYNDLDVVDEANISIYKWNDSLNAWIPEDSNINESANKIDTNISSFGSYAVGYDQTSPVLQWNSSDLHLDKIYAEAIVTDVGSGVNSSTVSIYLDEVRQNFTYDVFSGMLNSTMETSVGNHTIKIYAEDTSGNFETVELDVSVIEPIEITNLDINSQDNDSLSFEWEFENGTYSLDHFTIYQNKEILKNTTQNRFNATGTTGFTYEVYPIDTQGNFGMGAVVVYQNSQSVPLFFYEGNNTFYPTVGTPITFNASDSYVNQGTIKANILNYTWIFNDDSANATSGMTIDHVFESEGLNKIMLVIEDEQQNNASLIKVIDVANSTDSSAERLINGGFETGNTSGWVIDTEGSGAYYHHEYEVSEEHNYSGTHGCELDVSTFFHAHSHISLTQNVDLTDISNATFFHRRTYANDGGYGYCQLEFYVGDNMTIIPFSDTWEQESIDVSNYSGNHNITIKLFAICPLQQSIHDAKVEIDDISLIRAPDDWNPWNDPDSDSGALITTPELQEAINCWLNDLPAPITGEFVTTSRYQMLAYYWTNELECPFGAGA
ncbi:PKD domain-containing protein [Methanococcoides seepicolus]|uniref:PKD domain-containing protein n=1 Tax=Methanococcoides seepicolus TaxID=2828780 RepID=A0A9E4ZFN9_9EURY|nr:PKD domain-containing protein [Methanococcoides seepicolus]MCM1987048.1 hypothetical protein [Methanococcoides seepicolus]